MKTNGFAAGNILKGRFKLEEPYGTGTLFVNNKSVSKVLYVATDDDYVMISKKDINETENIYKELLTMVK